MSWRMVAVLIALALTIAFGSAFLPLPVYAASCGIASWYRHGTVTASGERFRPDGMTAAHRTLSFGAVLLITDQSTGRSVVVRINDRGPFVRGRAIDLSRAAAQRLGITKRGVALVCIRAPP